MTNDWKTIWSRKALSDDDRTLLQRMLVANGYDTGFGDMQESAWCDYVFGVADKLRLPATASVFDVGCGSGAFLLPLKMRGATVGGLDYSESLITIAAQNLDADGKSFIHAEAAELPLTPKYDAVLSSGVFFYFASLDYAHTVLDLMLAKAETAVAILDVPDLASKQAAIEFRQGNMGKAEYEKKYRGLEHLYYAKSWFADAFALHGVTDVVIEPQRIKNYAHNAFRYNVFAHKSRRND